MTNNTDNHEIDLAAPSMERQNSCERGCIHPRLVANYKSIKPLKPPRKNTADQYGSLNDESTYSEYAWEFLRRNRFYQVMIDQVTPSFNLDDWAYKAAPSYAPSCGLLEPYKHYSENFDDNNPPRWESFWQIASRTQDAMAFRRHRKFTAVDYPDLQVAIVLDLVPIFGPGTIGLRKQAEIAIKKVEECLKKGNSVPEPDDTDDYGSAYCKNKGDLRRYLRLADLLSCPQAVKTDDGNPNENPRRQVLTLREAALKLPDYDFETKNGGAPSNETKINRTYDFVDQAWDYIYGWKCLTLLAQNERPKKPKKVGVALQNNNTEQCSKMESDAEN